MINTIVHKEIHNKWKGKVIIDEIRQFTDDRGLLTELWRTDDAKINDSLSSAIIPQMSYWSVTNPFVMRGPHEHKDQCDWFVSWFNRMVYQLYNPQTDEMFYFVTDPTKVYRVKVDIGIIHSYRNLDLRPATTGNFPTALFMGEDKKKPIDEIRHEEKLAHDIKTYVVLGAGGRLGKALVERLYNEMGYHKYHVIPYYEKISNEGDVNKLFETLTTKKPVNCPGKISIINCAACTNVQALKTMSPDVIWSNVTLPVALANKADENNIDFFQISTDYVYRENDTSVYTSTKQAMEEALKSTKAHIIRVANLFSMNLSDTHNIISKLKEKAKNGETIQADPSQYIFPTDVDSLVGYIKIYVDNPESQELNLFGNPMTIIELYGALGGKNVTTTKSPINFNVNKFLKDGVYVNCTASIYNKISQ